MQPSSMQRAVYFRALATLFDAGIPLRRSFELLEGDMVGPALGEASGKVSILLGRGHSLGQAMRAQGSCFDALQRCVIELGIETGKLHTVLVHLARHEEARNAMASKLKAALVYPILIFVLSMAFVAIVPTLVFDSLFELLQDSGQELSMLTLAVAACARLLSSPWTYVVATVLALGSGFGLKRWLEKPEARLLVSRYLEVTPGVGPVVIASRLAQFSQALSLVIHSGYHLDRGLKLACSCSGSPVLAASADGMVRQLRDGEPLAQCLESSGLFPPLYWQSIVAGEESGQLTKMLDVLARVYSSELEHRLQRFAALLEPLSLLCLGVIVGVLVVACIQPLSAAFAGI